MAPTAFAAKLPQLPSVLRRDRHVLATIHQASAAELPHPWAFADRRLPPLQKKNNLDSLREQARRLPGRRLPGTTSGLLQDSPLPHLQPTDTALWRCEVLAMPSVKGGKGGARAPSSGMVSGLRNRRPSVKVLPPLRHRPSLESLPDSASVPALPVLPGPQQPEVPTPSSPGKQRGIFKALSSQGQLSPLLNNDGGSYQPLLSPGQERSRLGAKMGGRPRLHRAGAGLGDGDRVGSPDSPGLLSPSTPGLPPLDSSQVARIFGRLKEQLGSEMLCERFPAALKQLGFHELDYKSIDEIIVEIVGQSSFLDKVEFFEAVQKYRDRHIEQLSSEFCTFDLDGSGAIDAVELAAMLERLGITVIPGIVRELLREITGNPRAEKASLNAYLRLREIITCRGGFTTEEAENLRSLFQRYDDNGDGMMDFDELASALKWLGLSFHEEGSSPGGRGPSEAPQLHLLLQGIEFDPEKGLSHEEFLQVMRRHREMEIGWARELFAEQAGQTEAISWLMASEVVHTLGYITVSVDVLKECAEDIECETDTDSVEFNDFYMIFRRIRQREGFLRAELEEFQVAFQSHDTDGSGAVDVVEFGGALRWMGYPVTVEEQKALMDDVDVDKSGELDYDEFLKVMRWYKEEERKRIYKAFQTDDTDHCGTLNRQQVIYFLAGLGPHLVNGKTITLMVDEMCEDKEKITFHEVLRMIEELHAQCRTAFREKYGFHGDELTKLEELFAKYDRSKVGEITHQDISRLFQELFPDAGSREGRECAATILHQVDSDGDGRLGWVEFLHLMRLVQDRTEYASVLHEQKVAASCGFSRSEVADLRKIFKLCDTDESKSVEADEMIEMLGAMVSLSADKRLRVRQIFNEVSEDGSMSLNFAEFLTVLRRVYDEGLLPHL